MAKALLLLVCILVVVSCLIVVANAASDEDRLKEEVKSVLNERRRNRQECLVLGFITEQLECDTCDILKASFEVDGVSKTSETIYADSDIYNQCRSCCTKGKLSGDAMRLPTDSDDEDGDAAKFLPYDLPPTKTYAKARVEVSTFAFEQAGNDWAKLMGSLPTEFPIPSKSQKGAKATEESLVTIYSVYNRQSFIQLYDEGQEVPRGPPERLEAVGDEPSMVLDITHWDAGKLEEFLRHTISASKFNLQAAEKAMAEGSQTGNEEL